MAEAAGASPLLQDRIKVPRKKPGPLKRFWRRVRGPLAETHVVKRVLAELIASGLRFVDATNPRVAGSDDGEAIHAAIAPAIVTFWHGQHLLTPCLNRRVRLNLLAMFSRSADAELNAMVAERFGIEGVRGSGGRERERAVEKGGARALIALKKALDGGRSVAMIADIPHGTPREAGLGIVTLAKISGRPILPVALATSRRKVLEKSWDKTTINLPFGRSALCVGEPVFVGPDADAAEMEDKRRLVTDRLNAATARAYALVDGAA